MRTIEIDGQEYDVQYSPMSYIRLKQNFGIDIKQGEIAELEELNFTAMLQLILLGLVRHNSQAEIEALLDGDMTSVMSKFEEFMTAYIEDHNRGELPEEYTKALEEVEAEQEEKKE